MAWEISAFICAHPLHLRFKRAFCSAADELRKRLNGSATADHRKKPQINRMDLPTGKGRHG
jgi:hypothetical protein